ncbi:RidA family protein [Castellaniella sp. GW247-6E4]|uniref:RidA family protein n=1 Tax=Castellaniella sp. GW247-6E4 TaxID=3140380 RepID=UPI003314AF6F
MSITRGNPPGFKNVRASVYNHYVRVDNPKSLIFVSGQLARSSDGHQVGGNSMLEQTRQCLRNLELSLHAAGATMADVVWTTIYTVDIREFKEIVAAREEFSHAGCLPTSTMVEISHLSEPGLLVEIQAIAAI